MLVQDRIPASPPDKVAVLLCPDPVAPLPGVIGFTFECDWREERGSAGLEWPHAHGPIQQRLGEWRRRRCTEALDGESWPFRRGHSSGCGGGVSGESRCRTLLIHFVHRPVISKTDITSALTQRTKAHRKRPTEPRPLQPDGHEAPRPTIPSLSSVSCSHRYHESASFHLPPSPSPSTVPIFHDRGCRRHNPTACPRIAFPQTYHMFSCCQRLYLPCVGGRSCVYSRHLLPVSGSETSKSGVGRGGPFALGCCRLCMVFRRLFR